MTWLFAGRPLAVTLMGDDVPVPDLLRWIREAGAAGATTNAAVVLHERRRAERAIDELERRLGGSRTDDAVA